MGWGKEWGLPHCCRAAVKALRVLSASSATILEGGQGRAPRYPWMDMEIQATHSFSTDSAGKGGPHYLSAGMNVWLLLPHPGAETVVPRYRLTVAGVWASH